MLDPGGFACSGFARGDRGSVFSIVTAGRLSFFRKKVVIC